MEVMGVVLCSVSGQLRGGPVIVKGIKWQKHFYWQRNPGGGIENDQRVRCVFHGSDTMVVASQFCLIRVFLSMDCAPIVGASSAPTLQYSEKHLLSH